MEESTASPFFSIIIPVYNVAPYLRECLDSVLAQTFTNWEAICMDDGSTDESGAILDEYAAKDKRFRVIHQSNAGVSAARNMGLDIAKGEWIGFLDGDDVLNYAALKRSEEIIKCNPELDAVQFQLKRFAENTECSWDKATGGKWEIIDVSNTFAGTPTYNFTCFIYRRKVLGDIRFGRQTMGEDTLFLARFVGGARKVAVTWVVLYGYRIRAGSAMETELSDRKINDQIDSIIGILTVYSESSKTVPRAYWRTQCNALMETVPYEFNGLANSARAAVLKKWLDAVRMTTKQIGHKLTFVQLVRMKMCIMMPELTMPLLCRLPFWLKRHGVHR